MTGEGSGSVISPLLVNVYLHYVLDLSALATSRAPGDMIIVRYADDVIVGSSMRATPVVFSMRCARGLRSLRCRSIRTRPA
ncbi:hypothetical protein EB233_30080 [Mesorhizobium erdmanii]|uniref:Reverse transcriptase domain-containing protein n=1 Tax=Mesorhizobium erdmanii TaxID=1777866 RepID=A0A6M7UQQ4_9HYPH|nr:hypothetical protein EB233_30080 [Mesorhizobium erdmanii]